MGVKVRERPQESGVWWIFIDHRGRRKSKKIGRDKKTALEAARKIEAKLALGDMGITEDKPRLPRFKDYAELWLNGYVKGMRRETTYERYRDLLKHYFYPELGSKTLDEIRRGDVRDLLLKLHNGGLSRSTLSLVLNVISGPLSYAMDEELIAVNPTVGVSKRLEISRDKKAEIEPLTKDEVQHFLNVCQQYRPDYYPFFMTAFRTGARLGELCALQWGDVDWQGRFIRVNKSYKRRRITDTKTGKNRRVDMPDQLSDVLGKLHTQRKRKALQQGKGAPVPFIFHEKKGQPISQNTVRDVFKSILRKAGMRDRRVHDTRHTFASLLLSDGASPVYVKEQLGHSSIQMTVDIYGHLIPSSNRDAVNKLDSQPSATYPQPVQKQKA